MLFKDLNADEAIDFDTTDGSFVATKGKVKVDDQAK